MQDRRHTARFSWKQPGDAVLYVIDDVVVERYAEGELLVLASMAAKPDEILTVDRLAATSGNGAVNVRVVDSAPAFMDGQLRHRLRVRMRRSAADGVQGRVMAGLVRAIPVRLLDVGVGGCQLESCTPIEAGLYAELEVRQSQGARTERLRICRCRLVHGSGAVFRLGGQFVVADPASGLLRRNGLLQANGAEEEVVADASS